MRITCFENQPIRITVVFEAIESDWLISNKRATQTFRVFFPFSFLSFEYSDTLIQGISDLALPRKDQEIRLRKINPRERKGKGKGRKRKKG